VRIAHPVAFTITNGHSYRNGYGNADSNRNRNCNANADGYSDSDTNCHIYANSYSYGYGYSNSNTDGDSDGNAKTYTDAEAPSNSAAASLEMVVSDSGRVNLASSLRAGALLRASTCSGRRACHAEAWRRRVAREIRAIAAPNAFGVQKA
jgi:hypothetical protein